MSSRAKHTVYMRKWIRANKERWRKIHNKAARKYRLTHPQRVRKSARKWFVANRKKKQKWVLAWRERNPEKFRAHWMLRNAVNQGLVFKPSRCSRCKKRRLLNGHHDDYSKPLNVRWLCVPCHQRHHASKRHD